MAKKKIQVKKDDNKKQEKNITCHKCDEKPVITMQHGSLCQTHFISYFEEKVFKTINKFQLIGRNDKVCVATSGGKDSLTVLYLTKKYIERYQLPATLTALCVDEGIKDYRKHTIKDLKEFCKEHNIDYKIARSKDEFGATLDQAYPIINKDSKKQPCNVCGVWRRYVLNKEAKKLGATKVVTGHNLDDEAQAIVMNMFKANTTLAARLGPVSGIEERESFVQRVKPLYFCSDKEVRLYCLLKNFKVNFAECPYSNLGYRAHVRDMLNDFEQKYHGTKQGIIQSFLALLPLHKQQQDFQEMKCCQSCNEPTNKEICNACTMKEVLRHG